MTELLEQKANMWNITTALKKKITLFWIELSVPTAGQKAMSVVFFTVALSPTLTFLARPSAEGTDPKLKNFNSWSFAVGAKKKQMAFSEESRKTFGSWKLVRSNLVRT